LPLIAWGHFQIIATKVATAFRPWYFGHKVIAPQIIQSKSQLTMARNDSILIAQCIRTKANYVR
jgi:hypothetical protein